MDAATHLDEGDALARLATFGDAQDLLACRLFGKGCVPLALGLKSRPQYTALLLTACAIVRQAPGHQAPRWFLSAS